MSLDNYKHDVDQMFSWLGQLAYELDKLEATHKAQAERFERRENWTHDSVQSASVSTGNGPKSNELGASNSSGPVSDPMGLKIEIPLHDISINLDELDVMRQQRGPAAKPYHYRPLPVHLRMWTRNPHSNSWGVELRAWRRLSLAEQELTRRNLRVTK